MGRIDPVIFSGPRVYFTGFDNNLALFHHQRQKLIKDRITSLEISDKQSLIQLVDQLTSQICQSIKI